MRRLAFPRSGQKVGLLFLLLFFACSQKTEVTALRRENRFTLKYGGFEDELNLFDLASPGEINTHITMREGLFYIANGEAQKVMQFNSYGDLLTLYYNPETNPVPAFEAQTPNQGTRVMSPQTAVHHPFNNPGFTAVDSQKNVYVADQLPPERQQRDENRQLLLSQVVLRFSSGGTFLDYVGQQGLGGVPFPFIKDIFITRNNELVVVCQIRTGMLAYWYSPSGFLLYTIPINQADLPKPVPGENDGESYVSLKKVIPDCSEKKFYLAIDYYQSLIDQESKVQYSIEYDRTLMYTLEVETGEFTDPVVIPPFEREGDKAAQAVYRQAYDFLGQTESGWFFFIIPDDTGYLLQMIQQAGGRIQKRHLDVDSAGLVYYSFSLSSEGIISAILAGEESASVVWWRSDILLGNLR